MYNIKLKFKKPVIKIYNVKFTNIFLETSYFEK